MFLEKYKHIVQTISAAGSYNEDSDQENSGNSGEENFHEKMLMKKIKYIIFFREKIWDVWFSNCASSFLKHNSFLSFGLQSFISENITETFLWKKILYGNIFLIFQAWKIPF